VSAEPILEPVDAGPADWQHDEDVLADVHAFLLEPPLEVTQPPEAPESPEVSERAAPVGVERTRLSTLRPERVNWYLEGLVPKNHHTVLAAPGGTVKGLFSLYLVAHHIPSTVLYFGTEDDFRQIILPRAMALEMDVDRFVPIFKRDNAGELYSFRFPSDRTLLEQQLDETKAGAFILDGGVEHLDEGLAANKAEDVRRLTSMLNLVARERRVLPIDILHTNKTKDARGVDRVGHAKTWTDASRHVLMAAIDDEDDAVRHIQVTKTNLSKTGYGRAYRILTRAVRVYDTDTGEWVEDQIPYLADEGESGKSVDELLAGKPAETKSAQARELILDILEADGEQESDGFDARVADETGLTAKTVRNLRGDLKNEGLIRSMPDKDEHGEIVCWKISRTAAPR
jgi:hypothetical protein